MRGRTSKTRPVEVIDWPAAIHNALKSQRVRQVSYVPDAGHKRLIELCHADQSMTVVPLTTEEEGIGLAAGAWLGGERAALLMQSSGVGNCANALTLTATCAFPLLMLVTMRGEGLGRAEEASAVANSAAKVAFEEQSAVALLISQQLIGVKSFEEKR